LELGVLPALLALAVSVSPASPNRDKSAPLRGSLSGIVTADDYPPDALDLNQEGSVGVLVRVDANGAVSDCVITASSGSAALDAQTCRLIWLRAKFTPARDRSGAPVASTYQQRINWRIGDDEDGASSEPWMVRWIVSGRGNVFPSCQSDAGGLSQIQDAPSAQCPAYIAGISVSLSGRAKNYAEIVVEQRFSVGQMPTLGLAPGDELVGRELAQLDVDPTGKIVSCKVLEVVGSVPPQLSRTCLITAKQYTPRKDVSGSPAPFTAYFMTAVYARHPDLLPIR
jgi:TonB family protein